MQSLSVKISDDFWNSALTKGSNELESVEEWQSSKQLQREEEGGADGCSPPLLKEKNTLQQGERLN